MSKSLRHRLLAASLTVSLSAGLVAPAFGETLTDALVAAYDGNPTLLAQRATQRAIDENYVQARTGWRPTLTSTARRVGSPREG